MATTLKNRPQRKRKIKFGDKTYINDRPYMMGLIPGRCYQLAKNYINDEDEDHPSAQVLKRYMFLGRFDTFEYHANMLLKAIIFINDYDDRAKPIVTKIYVHDVKPSKLWFKEVDCVQPNNIALGILASRKNGKAQLPHEIWRMINKASKALPRKPKLSESNRRTGRKLSPVTRASIFKEGKYTGYISGDSSSSNEPSDSPITQSPSSSSSSSSSKLSSSSSSSSSRSSSSSKRSGGRNKTFKSRRS
jgi:hypothetical protein